MQPSEEAMPPPADMRHVGGPDMGAWLQQQSQEQLQDRSSGGSKLAGGIQAQRNLAGDFRGLTIAGGPHPLHSLSAPGGGSGGSEHGGAAAQLALQQHIQLQEQQVLLSSGGGSRASPASSSPQLQFQPSSESGGGGSRASPQPQYPSLEGGGGGGQFAAERDLIAMLQQNLRDSIATATAAAASAASGVSSGVATPQQQQQFDAARSAELFLQAGSIDLAHSMHLQGFRSLPGTPPRGPLSLHPDTPLQGASYPLLLSSADQLQQQQGQQQGGGGGNSTSSILSAALNQVSMQQAQAAQQHLDQMQQQVRGRH